MTEYERGQLAMRERAAKVCKERGEAGVKKWVELGDEGMIQQKKSDAWECVQCAHAILSLTPEAPASQPDGVVVPREELLRIARLIEDLKRPCSMDPESPQAIRNGHYQSIALSVRAMLAAAKDERDAQGAALAATRKEPEHG